MTLRFRLTLLYTFLMGGTLLLFGALVYGLVSLILLDQIDSSITNQADSIIQVLRVNSSGQFDLRPLDVYQPSDNNLMFQVWGTDRKLQFSRPRSWLRPLDDVGRQTGSVMFNSTYSRGGHLRVLSLPLVTDRGPSGVLQVGVSLELLDVTQSVLSSVLIILAAISMAITGLVAYLAINQALAPLATVTEIATTITKADDLTRRIPLTAPPENEVGQLILAFNETLSRLEALFATQKRFVADVSHELRTPLTVIKGEVSLMRKMGGVDDDSLLSIESEVDRLTRMVSNLLLLAQAESGKLPLDLKLIELDTILLEVFQQMKTLSGDRINLIIPEIDQVHLIGDRDRLKQVLLNIVGNAVQYTPNGGTVNLSLNKQSNQARIIVSDTGPGIAAEDLPHIFERFYRGEKSRSRTHHSGFGLGLSISYWIVRSHGGTIEVSSPDGQGATFCIWIPLQQPEKE